MKKILFLFLCLIGGVKVNAETYYSDYSNFSDYSSDVVEESDIVDVEVQRRYMWTCMVMRGDYYKIGNNPPNNPHLFVTIYRDGEYSDWSLEYPEDSYGTIVETRTVCNEDCSEKYIEYRYKERYYYHFGYFEEKSDDYYVYMNNCGRNYDDYKDFYRYRTRERIEVPNSIVITDYEQQVENFIKSTTKYEVHGNVNKYVNGEYKLEIKTFFINIPINVKVNIEDNLIKDYNDKINEKDSVIQHINKQLNLEKKKNELLINELDSLNTINNKTIVSLKKELEKNKELVYYCEEQSEKLIKEKKDYFEAYSMKINEIGELNSQLFDKDKIIKGLNIKLNNLNEEILDINSRLEICSTENISVQKQLSDASNEILKLNRKLNSSDLIISNVKNLLVQADNEVTDLTNIVNKNSNLEDKYIDVSKMLEICNITNEKLQEKLDIREKNNNKNKVLWIFVCCLFFLFLCAFKLLKKEFNK